MKQIIIDQYLLPNVTKILQSTDVGIIVTTNENISIAVPDNGTHFALEELKEAIGGGYIEPYYLHDQIQLCSNIPLARVNWIMFGDDEAKHKSLPLNQIATSIFRDAFKTRDTIRGDVILVPFKMVE